MPALFIIAGPVGAGKTTFYEAYLKEPFPTLVPALRHQQLPFLDERRSFAVEDIHVDTQLLDQAKAAGFSTRVLFTQFSQTLFPPVAPPGAILTTRHQTSVTAFEWPEGHS
jgi:GTPase SAR1 family protein